MRITKYEQLAAYLKQEYIYGKAAMSPLPSIPRLMDSQGISQATVDRALSLLEQDGLIVKKPGIGCFVAKSADQLTDDEAPDHLSMEIARSGQVQRPPVRAAVCSMPGETNPLWTALADAMSESDIGLKLDLVYHNVSQESYRSLLDADLPVDLVYASPANIDWLVSEDLLMDLSEFDRPWEEQAVLLDLPSRVAARVVPYSYVARVVLYDQAIMEALGYDYSRGWSWADFRQICVELREEVPADRPVLLLDDYRAFFSQWGIELVGPDKRVQFDNDLVAEALHYLRDLYQQLRAFPLCSQLDLQAIVGHLRDAHPVLCIGRTPWKTRLEQMGASRLGMWPVPLGEGGFQTMAINYLGIYAYSYFPEQAWDVIRYICSEKGQRIIDTTHLEFPLHATGVEHPHAQEMLRRFSSADAQPDASTVLHRSSLPSRIMDQLTCSVLNPEIESFLQGHTTTATCMGRITRIGSTMVRNAIAHSRRIGLL